MLKIKLKILWWRIKVKYWIRVKGFSFDECEEKLNSEEIESLWCFNVHCNAEVHVLYVNKPGLRTGSILALEWAADDLALEHLSCWNRLTMHLKTYKRS